MAVFDALQRRIPRHLVPGLVTSATMLGLSVVERQGLPLGFELAIVNAAAVLYFTLLVAAPLILVPVLFFRGHTAAQIVLGALLPGFLWWITEVFFRLRHHSLAEALFLPLFLPNFLHLQFLATEILLAFLLCRIIARWGLGRNQPVFTRYSLAALIGVALWVGSSRLVLPPYYSAYQETYRKLFMENLLPLPSGYVGPLEEEVAPSAGSLPNIVVILSDDHRWDTMSGAGHPFVKTPNIDRLATEGVRFENAFVTSSLCSPSRASFLTGQYPQRHGVFNNFTPWSDENRTFFEYLEAVGYDTAFIGKWHMPGKLPNLRGVNHFITFEAVGGQGQYFDCPLIVDGVDEPSRTPYIAEELTNRAIEFLDRERDRPFVLYLSHKNVHAPFSPHPDDQSAYADADVALPPNAHSWVGFTDAQYNHLSFFRIETYLRQYAAAVTSMDRQIGRLLQHLEAKGELDDTFVMYTSDNGYLWGEHRLIDKRWAYEESIRVPMVVRYPRIDTTKVTRAMALNIDLAPTLLDLAGIPTPTHMQGRSLLPLIAAPGATVRDAFYYNYFFEPPFPVPTTHAIRTNTHKYIEHEGGEVELFDLTQDQTEANNLAAQPQHLALATRLRQQLAELRDAAH